MPFLRRKKGLGRLAQHGGEPHAHHAERIVCDEGVDLDGTGEDQEQILGMELSRAVSRLGGRIKRARGRVVAEPPADCLCLLRTSEVPEQVRL